MLSNIYNYLFKRTIEPDKMAVPNSSKTDIPKTNIQKKRVKTLQRKLKDKAIQKHKKRAKKNAERIQQMTANGIHFGYDEEQQDNECNGLLDTRTNDDEYYNKKYEWVINNNNRIKHHDSVKHC